MRIYLLNVLFFLTSTSFATGVSEQDIKLCQALEDLDNNAIIQALENGANPNLEIENFTSEQCNANRHRKGRLIDRFASNKMPIDIFKLAVNKSLSFDNRSFFLYTDFVYSCGWFGCYSGKDFFELVVYNGEEDEELFLKLDFLLAKEYPESRIENFKNEYNNRDHYGFFYAFRSTGKLYYPKLDYFEYFFSRDLVEDLSNRSNGYTPLFDIAKSDYKGYSEFIRKYFHRFSINSWKSLIRINVYTVKNALEYDGLDEYFEFFFAKSLEIHNKPLSEVVDLSDIVFYLMRHDEGHSYVDKFIKNGYDLNKNSSKFCEEANNSGYNRYLIPYIKKSEIVFKKRCIENLISYFFTDINFELLDILLIYQKELILSQIEHLVTYLNEAYSNGFDRFFTKINQSELRNYLEYIKFLEKLGVKYNERLYHSFTDQYYLEKLTSDELTRSYIDFNKELKTYFQDWNFYISTKKGHVINLDPIDVAISSRDSNEKLCKVLNGKYFGFKQTPLQSVMSYFRGRGAVVDYFISDEDVDINKESYCYLNRNPNQIVKGIFSKPFNIMIYYYDLDEIKKIQKEKSGVFDYLSFKAAALSNSPEKMKYLIRNKVPTYNDEELERGESVLTYLLSKRYFGLDIDDSLEWFFKNRIKWNHKKHKKKALVLILEYHNSRPDDDSRRLILNKNKLSKKTIEDSLSMF